MKAKDLKVQEDSVVAQLILAGDLSKLNATDRVTYYRGYCERIGLDPFTKPFDILRLNGKEVLYLTRSGAQQLNKLHGVSHQITAREVIAGEVYQVTARATLPDGRHTESIGAVSVAGMKGENYCNAIMKAETKAKRRSTLDLLGLGILSEEEAVGMPGTTTGVIMPTDAEVAPSNGHGLSHGERIRLTYDNEQAVIDLIGGCATLEQLMTLYRSNEAIASRPSVKELFQHRKLAIHHNSKP
jgi:hypothetical protein